MKTRRHFLRLLTVEDNEVTTIILLQTDAIINVLLRIYNRKIMYDTSKERRFFFINIVRLW